MVRVPLAEGVRVGRLPGATEQSTQSADEVILRLASVVPEGA